MSDLIQQTVIVGGGFTGLFTAVRLSRSNYPRSVILIDREDRFRFKPLLYDYFSGQMDEPQVMPCFEALLAGSGVTFVQDTVEGIDLHQQQVTLASGTPCPYSNLVLALGSVTGYFGVEGAKDYALPFREGKDAIAVEDHSLPPTAQVAHQQGEAIAFNLQALVEGKELKSAEVGIRGTLMKLGLEEAAANIFNQLEVNGEVGHLIRQGTYMNILPTPLRDMKLTAKWFNEEVYQEYVEPQFNKKSVKWVAGAVIGTLIARKLLKELGDEDNS